VAWPGATGQASCQPRARAILDHSSSSPWSPSWLTQTIRDDWQALEDRLSAARPDPSVCPGCRLVAKSGRP